MTRRTSTGSFLFVAEDGTNGTELWRSDGTAAGTALVKYIKPGAGGSDPSVLANLNRTLFFAATDGSDGTELWKSDGTIAGTKLAADIRRGVGSSSPSQLTDVNAKLFFTADDGIHGTPSRGHSQPVNPAPRSRCRGTRPF